MSAIERYLARSAVLLVLGGCSMSEVVTASPSGDAGVGAIQCGPGTLLSGNLCLPADAGVGTGGTMQCGPGTMLVGSQCLPSDAGVGTSCGPGTLLLGTTCVPIDAGVGTSCGPGTLLLGTTCVPIDAGPSVVTCGPGTTAMGNVCVALGIAYYDVRVPVTSIPGDGHSKIPLTVLGRNADGTPATDAVVLIASRPAAGTFAPVAITLGATPSTVWFTPCSTANSVDCVGPFRIEVALASDHSVILAQSTDLAILEPTGIGSSAACLGSPNALYFDGQGGSYIYSGTQLLTQGTFGGYTNASGGGMPSMVHIGISPASQSQGLWWDTYFTTEQLGQPLMTTVYTGAERWPFESSGRPGIDISGDGRGCNQEFGSFQIERLVMDTSGLVEFLATFEQHCESITAPALRGCVHYTR